MLSLDNLVNGMVVKLPEATHGQWLYPNIQARDSVTGRQPVLRKEELQREIEEQMELEAKHLDDQDKYLLEINLCDLDHSSGEDQ